MSELLRRCFEGKRVLITGHTGFKGSWLTLWLQKLGARTVGFSLAPPTAPSLFSLCALEETMSHIHGDIRDFASLAAAVESCKPDVVFHLAAQSLVLDGYKEPRETFEVNSQGTVNLLEAVRRVPSVRALLMITTDKVYENKEWLWGYRENDPLGGSDPYSASKGMAELAVSSYSRSFFSSGPTAVASLRAGNIIGGGDFSNNRLLPDAMKALMRGEEIPLRNGASVRPWLHLLDPLSGYLTLAAKLLEEGRSYSGAWNFGPLEQEAITCRQMVEKAIEFWGSGSWCDASSGAAKAEMALLRLNWDKAANKLGWRPCYRWDQAVAATVHWYKAFQQLSTPEEIRALCHHQIDDYCALAEEKGVRWAAAPEEAAVR